MILYLVGDKKRIVKVIVIVLLLTGIFPLNVGGTNYRSDDRGSKNKDTSADAPDVYFRCGTAGSKLKCNSNNVGDEPLSKKLARCIRDGRGDEVVSEQMTCVCSKVPSRSAYAIEDQSNRAVSRMHHSNERSVTKAGRRKKVPVAGSFRDQIATVGGHRRRTSPKQLNHHPRIGYEGGSSRPTSGYARGQPDCEAEVCSVGMPNRGKGNVAYAAGNSVARINSDDNIKIYHSCFKSECHSKYDD